MVWDYPPYPVRRAAARAKAGQYLFQPPKDLQVMKAMMMMVAITQVLVVGRGT